MIRAYIMDQDYGFKKGIAIIREWGEKKQILKSLPNDSYEWVEMPAGIYDSTIYLPREACEAMVEALLENGIKPEKESKLEGILQATERHLEDMRKLVFKTK